MFNIKIVIFVIVSAFAMASLFVSNAQCCAPTTNSNRTRREAVSEAAVVVLETSHRYNAASSDKILKAVTKQIRALIQEMDIDEHAFGAVSKSVEAGVNGNVQVLFAMSHGTKDCDELERVVDFAVEKIEKVDSANVLCGGSSNTFNKRNIQ